MNPTREAQTRVAELEARLDEQTRRADEHARELEERNQMLRKARRAIESLQAEVEDEKTRQQEQRELLGSVESERERLVRENQAMDSELAQARASLTATGGEAANLAGERSALAEKLRASVAVGEQATRALAEEQAAGRQVRAERDEAREALARERATLVASERALAEQRSRVSELEQQAAFSEGALVELRGRVGALTSEHAGLLAQASASSDGATFARRTELRVEGLLEQLAPAQASLAAGQALADAASAERAEAAGALARCEAELRVAQQRWREAEATSAQLGVVLGEQTAQSSARHEAAARLEAQRQAREEKLEARLGTQERAMLEQLERVRAREVVLAGRISEQRAELAAEQQQRQAETRDAALSLAAEGAGRALAERLLAQTADEADAAARALADARAQLGAADRSLAEARGEFGTGLRALGQRLRQLEAGLGARARVEAEAATEAAEAEAAGAEGPELPEALLGRMRALAQGLSQGRQRLQRQPETAEGGLGALRMWEATAVRVSSLSQRAGQRGPQSPAPGRGSGPPVPAGPGRLSPGHPEVADRSSALVLAEACRVLQLSEPAQLLPLLARLSAALLQLPSLEAMAAALGSAWQRLGSAYAQPGHSALGPAQLPPLEQLGPLLEAWLRDVQLASRLTALRAQLCAALRSRPQAQPEAGAEAAAERAGADGRGEGLWEPEAIVASVRELVATERSLCALLAQRPHLAAAGPHSPAPFSQPLGPARGQTGSEWCVEGVHELVRLEQQLLGSARTGSAAQAHMAAVPSHFVHRAISLFQRLFDVRELDDLDERIWAVHLAHTDAHKLRRALCHALRVPQESTVAQLINQLQEV